MEQKINTGFCFDVVDMFSLWEHAIVNDTAQLELAKAASIAEDKSALLKALAAEEEFEAHSGVSGDLAKDARDIAESKPKDSKVMIAWHLNQLVYYLFEPKWLNDLGSYLPRLEADIHDGKATPAQASNFLHLAEVYKLVCDTNGNSPNRVPRSLPRSVFKHMKSASMWEYSAGHTDIKILALLADLKWMTKTNGTGKAQTWHPTRRFFEVAEAVTNFKKPEPLSVKTLLKGENQATKVTMRQMPWSEE